MFGFIRKKMKAFTDAFSEEAEEEIIEADPAEPRATETTRADAAQPEAERTPAETVPETDEPEPVNEPGIETTSADVSEHETVEPEAIETVKDAAVDEQPSAHRQRAPVSEPVDEPTDDAAIEPTLTPETVDEPKPERRGLRERFVGALTKRTLSDEQFDTLFADLEIGLLEANTAYDAVQAVKENLRTRLTGERVSRFSAGDDVAQALKESIAELFEEPEDLVALAGTEHPLVIMLIGINGSGKTTSAAKLARAFQKAGKTPVLAAADTFRAAAIQQLEEHAKALDCRIIKHDYGADPAAVAFDAIAHAKSGKADVVLIDTAGRLHSNENLLKELEKVKRVAQPHRIIFVGESIAGNDLLEQAQTFNEKVGIDGIILTKADVDESGGGALSVSHVTNKPIDYFGSGQSYDDLEPFSIDRMAQLLGLE